MDIIIHRKEIHLNTLENSHIYKISKDNLQICDTNTYTHNPIFKALQATNTEAGMTTNDFTETLTTNKHDDRLPSRVMPLQ
jgi:hypothetical protein